MSGPLPRKCANRACRAPLAQRPTGRRRLYCHDGCKQAANRKRNDPTRLGVMYSSRSDNWTTPRDKFDELACEFGGFDLDPCASPENATCGRYFTAEQDGLAQEWSGRVFMNPPYGRTIGRWMEKAWRSSQTTADLVVCLVPARPDTAWWHSWAMRGEVRFCRGRLKFGGARTPAPFPSAEVVFRNPASVTKGEAS
jgi:phage N-6-adenine-methyltransferase